MSLGPTHYTWRPDVLRVVNLVRTKFPNTHVNTYVGHPWPGWDGQSFDVWGPGGRGYAIDYDLGLRIAGFCWDLPGAPWIRHEIYEHTQWDYWRGNTYWAPNDHSGPLRHYHVTYF